MIRTKRYFLLPFAMFTQAVVAEAASSPPVILHRSAHWEVNYSADGCDLSGVFGTGNDAIFMRLTRFEPGDSFDLSLFGKPLHDDGSAFSEISLNFGPGGHLVATKAINGRVNDLPMRIIRSWRLDNLRQMSSKSDVGPVTPEHEKVTQSLDVDLGGSRFFRLDLGSMGSPMAAFRKCTDALVSTWGFDPVQQSLRLRKPIPKGAVADWVSWQSYPARALLNKESGIVHYRLDVDDAGAVTGCHVLAATEPDEFGAVTCQQLRANARFDPALDASGKPTKSFYLSYVQWMMPGR